ncbi:hypothetical protein Tco_0448813 [Tanacetum coccineum]
MEKANLPPTNNRPVLPVTLRTQAVQELYELQRISAFVDSRLESIERFLNNFANQPNKTNMNNLESDDESVDTPIVSTFPHSDNDLDDGEVLNELIEYEMKSVAYFNPFLLMNIITRKAYNTIMVEGLETVMSFESSMVTYTFVYTNFEPGRVFWGADEELSDVVSPTSHARQPLPPVVSPTAKSPGYVTESDPEEDPEEYEDDGIGVMGRLLSHGRGRDGER